MRKVCLHPLPLIITVLLLAGCGSEQTGPPASGFNGDVNFRLPDAPNQKLPAWGPGSDGTVQPIRPSKGELMIVFFGFTSCPDVCPLTLGATGAAVRKLSKEQQAQVEGAMITVDPARDNGPEVQKYVAKFFAKNRAWGYRTEDSDELNQVERAFGAHSEVEKGGHSAHEDHDGYDVDHSTFRYAINRQGEVVLMWQESVTPEEVAEDLARLLEGD